MDRDNDGYPSDEDCDDDNPNVHPGAPEICDDIDSDCDGETDDSHAIDAAVYHPDFDSDGRGDASVALTSCTPPEGHVIDDTDCDDTTPRISPDVAEICDGLDNDCDEEIDEADARNAPTWHLDQDQDGYGDPTTPGTTACDGPPGHADNGDDCDDDNEDIHPNTEEIWYDGIDQDCDGWSDADQDRDGFDHKDHGGLDCDDDDGAIHPDADEICDDGIDNNCDGTPGTCGMHGEMSIDRAISQITGEDARDQAGNTITAAGDVNGDGYTDLLIDARFSDLGGDNAGAVYLMFGPPAPGEIGLESADAIFVGETPEDQLGSTILGAGDLTGDGITDVILTSTNNDAGGAAGGSAYIVHGPLEASLNIADADGQIWGESLAMHLGYSATTVSDQDSDGLQDIALGAPLYSALAGHVAIVSGATSESVGLETATLSHMDGTTDDDALGASLAAIDWDGDGVTELLIGAPECATGGGLRLGAVFGSHLPLPASALDADWQATGPEEQSRFGHIVINAGDINGDGLDDILVGASGTDGTETDAGAAYLFLGPFDGSLTASDASATFLGIQEADNLGSVLAAPGDLNGDDIPDLAMGAPTHSPDATLSSQAGLVLIFSGDSRGVNDAATDAVAWIQGEAAGDEAGTSITGLGDVDGDGIDDLLIGAPYQDSAGPNAGAVYVLAGGGI